MKFIIQRVTEASVSVDEQPVGNIQQGYLILIGVSDADTQAEADRLVRKMLNLRIFSDENGKTNLSLKDVDGELLLISQFTLYADWNPEHAKALYEYIIDSCKKERPVVQQGVFGAHMKVQLVNDGPFTVILDSEELS